MDVFEPEVGAATLERLGCSVEHLFDQTCCGQPMVDASRQAEAVAAENLFVEKFSASDYIVCPSSSCAHQVRAKLTGVEQTGANILELTEFPHDVLKAGGSVSAQSRNPLQLQFTGGIGLANSSEPWRSRFSKPPDRDDIMSALQGAYDRPEFHRAGYAVSHTRPLGHGR
jgi:hypothetical protein